MYLHFKSELSSTYHQTDTDCICGRGNRIPEIQQDRCLLMSGTHLSSGMLLPVIQNITTFAICWMVLQDRALSLHYQHIGMQIWAFHNCNHRWPWTILSRSIWDFQIEPLLSKREENEFDLRDMALPISVRIFVVIYFNPGIVTVS